MPFLSKLAKAATPSSAAGQPAEDETASEAGDTAGEKGDEAGEPGSEKADKEPEHPPPDIVALDLEKLDKLLDADDVWLIAAYDGAAANPGAKWHTCAQERVGGDSLKPQIADAGAFGRQCSCDEAADAVCVHAQAPRARRAGAKPQPSRSWFQTWGIWPTSASSTSRVSLKRHWQIGA